MGSKTTTAKTKNPTLTRKVTVIRNTPREDRTQKALADTLLKLQKEGKLKIVDEGDGEVVAARKCARVLFLNVKVAWKSTKKNT